MAIGLCMTGANVMFTDESIFALESDDKRMKIWRKQPKDVLSDSGLEIELAIPFVPNRDPPDTPQQSELGEVVHYHPSE
ncbi:hypothetical protein TNCV_654821 [Trichonephila clavipes]|nr:hypothetical protein TNCV_654821 [Trichonephila clavipes]